MSRIPRAGQSWRTKKQGVVSRLFEKLVPYAKTAWKKARAAGLVKNAVLGVLALGLLGVIMFLGLFAFLSRDLPDPNSLTNRDIAQSTKIYDRTGEHLLYEIAGDEKRTLVTLEQIPDYLEKATITAEDRAFYEHKGISIKGILRAVFTNITSFDPTGQGASTITQQLVKNAILTNEKTYTRKIKEIILSLALERRYTKEEILQLYLNEIPYGSTNYGVQSASQAYFEKSVENLSLAEAATLAALPKATTTFLNNPDRLKERRDWILTSMEELGYISAEDRDAALAEETPVRIAVSNIEAPHFVLWVKELLEAEYSERTVEQGGLTVITSLDYEKQKMAEEAVVANKEARAETYDFNNSGLVSMDPNNGHIMALVGSADYFDDEIDGQVNVALRPLQPGSSIKPIIYTAAFERGYTPNSILWDTETDFATSTGNYHPRNYDLSEHGPVTIRKALQGSLNIPAVKTLALIGVDAGIDFAQRLKYTTLEDRSRFGLAMVLGGAEVKLIEHTAAYATFAAEGVYREPVAILKVTDPSGEVLQEWKENEGERVMDVNIARMTTNVLSDDAARAYAFGTGSLLTLPGRPVATKTGTTNDYNDAWTVGYTPQLVTGVWTGNTNGSEMARGAGGSSVAAPIWNQYMRAALADAEVQRFTAPNIPVTGKPILDGQIPSQTVTIDTASGKLATENTPERFRETKTCGEFHTILHFVNPSNPLGDAPSDPTKQPMYTSWEAGVQSYLVKQRAKAEETGETPMEVCEIPTEEDDVHTVENRPTIEIRSPRRGDTVNESVNVQLEVRTQRGFSRVEYTVNDSLILVDFDPSGGEVTIPSWVGTGKKLLKVTVYDDVDNSASDEVEITVKSTGDVKNLLTITNPFKQQTIEKSDETYTIVVEARTAADLASVSVEVQNLWTGETTQVGSISAPDAFNSFVWTLPNPAAYVIRASATYKAGGREDAQPIVVRVVDKAGGPLEDLILIDLPGGDDEEGD